MKNDKRLTERRNTIRTAAMLALVAMWLAIPYFRSSAQDTSLPIVTRTATLTSPTGSVNPHGLATWKLYANGNREIEIEIEDVTAAMGTALDGLVNGTVVGQMIVDDRSRARLKLRTADGNTVPATDDGTTVAVNNGSGTLANGVFAGGGPTPTPTVSPTGSPTPSPTPTGTPNAGDLFASLTGATINGVLPRGFAQYEVHSSRTEIEVRVSQVNLPDGTTLTVSANGGAIGTMVVSGGEARLRLRSDNGDNVPALTAGSSITVAGPSGTILSGTFAGFTGPSPTPNPSPSPAQARAFEAHLSGGQIVPPVSTTARGEIKVTLNADETQATVFGEFNALTGTQTGGRLETTVGTVTVLRDLAVVGGHEGHFAPAAFAITPVQVQQLRAGTVRAVITSNAAPDGEIAGILTPHTSNSDFDGDGSHDISLFRPATGTWYTQNSAGFAAQTLGTAADRIVSGDYDGDGKTEAAVYQDVNGQGVWNITRSSDGGTTTTSFGLATDLPVRGDFDGDGRIDIAVFRPANGMWYIEKSGSTGITYVPFGQAGDKPLTGDMDGDGRDDTVVFRPSDGNWYWRDSSTGQFRAIHFGQSGDIPVRGDFDGDGRADAAVFRPSNGTWYVNRSSDSGFSGVQFGMQGDVPVAGDYDNDGRTDVAVFRPSDGTWYILRSSDGNMQADRFGLNGDIPVISQ